VNLDRSYGRLQSRPPFLANTYVVKQSLIALVLGVALLATVSVAASDDSTSPANGYGQAVASKELVQLLTYIQKLDQGGLLALHVWAGYSRPQAPAPVLSDLDEIETTITQKLSAGDRDAILSWLAHGDRGKLLARGATNAEIGPCVDNVDHGDCNASISHTGTTTATAGAFRDLVFTLAPGNNQDGGISIERGFAFVKNDATSETHCLTFKNVGPKKIDALTFVYKLHAQSGDVVDAGSNVRAGSFEAGSEVAGPATAPDLGGIRSDGPDKMLLANCWTKNTQVATPALLRATYITVGVASVIYDDGTHWALGQ
jgi:hypothetical protein